MSKELFEALGKLDTEGAERTLIFLEAKMEELKAA